EICLYMHDPWEPHFAAFHRVLRYVRAGQRKPEGQWTGDERKAANSTATLTYISDSKDEEEVSSNDNEMVEVKVLMALAEDNDAVSKEGVINSEWVKISIRKCTSEQIPSQKKRILGVDQLTEDPFSSGQKDIVFVKSSADDKKVSIFGVERPWLSKTEGFILPNHDTGRILPAESQRNTNDPPIALIDSSATDYDSADKSLVCSTPLPLLKKLDGAEPVSRLKTIKSIIRLKSTFKAETLKGVIINEPSSAPAKGNKSSSASKVNLAPTGKLKSVKIKDDPPLAIGGSSSRSRTPKPLKYFFPPCIHCGFSDHLSDDCVNDPICDICGSYDHDTHVHTTTDHNDIKWFRRGEALQAKKAEALKSTKVESSNANRSKTPTKSNYGVIGKDILKGTYFGA
ncbi:hypothetical protein Tco_1270160, partial [Tanacetum coccineum]